MLGKTPQGSRADSPLVKLDQDQDSRRIAIAGVIRERSLLRSYS
jgi:hypothetical protein